MWDRVNNLFKNEFDYEPGYKDKYTKVKISLYNVNFYSNKMPTENERYTHLSEILLNSVINVDKKYPQVF